MVSVVAVRVVAARAAVFTVMCDLPPGYHQYKFIVDGQWRHDENQAFIQDPLGNVNNWLYMKPAGGSTPPPTSAPGAAEPVPISGPVPVPMNRPAMSGESGGMDWVQDAGGGGFGDYAATANRAASTKLRRTSMELQSNQRANVDVESGHDGQQPDTSGARVEDRQAPPEEHAQGHALLPGQGAEVGQV